VEHGGSSPFCLRVVYVLSGFISHLKENEEFDNKALRTICGLEEIKRMRVENLCRPNEKALGLYF
jgi:hypothetical protein